MLPFKNPLGRPLKLTPAQLAEEFGKYAQWCKDNPLVAHTRVDYAKGFSDTTDERPRMVSIDGFLVYLGCSDCWWSQLSNGKRGDEFSRVKDGIKKYCELSQKEQAAAGLLNANIISRLLGLADKKEVEAKGDGLTIVVNSAADKDKIDKIAEVGI